MVKRRPRLFRLFLSLLLTGILGACGIEDYPYLFPVDKGNISPDLNTRVFILLPTGQDDYFQYYIIYYRIYISGLLVDGEVFPADLSGINSTLASNYNSLLSYTNTDNKVVPTNMESIFSNLKYYPLVLQNIPIEIVLSELSGSARSITLDFARPSPLRPALYPANSSLIPPDDPNWNPLWRYSEYGRTIPYGNNRNFVNSSDLNDDSKRNETTFTNLDVALNSQSISGDRYSYVSMYIMAYGVNYNTLSPVYSTPTFIGVFRLPD